MYVSDKTNVAIVVFHEMFLKSHAVLESKVLRICISNLLQYLKLEFIIGIVADCGVHGQYFDSHITV